MGGGGGGGGGSGSHHHRYHSYSNPPGYYAGEGYGSYSSHHDYGADCGTFRNADDYSSSSRRVDRHSRPDTGYSASYTTQEYAPSGLSRYEGRPSSSTRDRSSARYYEVQPPDPLFLRGSTRPDDGARDRAAARYAERSATTDYERLRSPFSGLRPSHHETAEYVSPSDSRPERYYSRTYEGHADPFEASLRAARNSQFWLRGNETGGPRDRLTGDMYSRYSLRGDRPSWTTGDDRSYAPSAANITGRGGSFGSGWDFSGYDFGQSSLSDDHGRSGGGGGDGMDRLAREAARRRR